jgi:hypothetical protein
LTLPCLVDFGFERVGDFPSKKGEEFFSYPVREVYSGGSFNVVLPKAKIREAGKHLLDKPGKYLMRLPMRQDGWDIKVDGFAVFHDNFSPADQKLVDEYMKVMELVKARFSLPPL